MAISTEYKAYLKSPEWNEKRLKALRKAKYKCQRCGKSKPLQVHHLTYKRIFNELPQDLQALCFSCHKWVHIKKDFVKLAKRIFRRVRLWLEAS